GRAGRRGAGRRSGRSAGRQALQPHPHRRHQARRVRHPRRADIHVEPYEKEFRVRFRIDGILYEIMNPPLKLRDAMTSRLKILAKLDISEKRLPQDGRIKLKMKLNEKNKELEARGHGVPELERRVHD